MSRLVALERALRDAEPVRAPTVAPAYAKLLVLVLQDRRAAPDATNSAIEALGEVLSRVGDPRHDMQLAWGASHFLDAAIARMGRPPRPSREFRGYHVEASGRRSHVVEWTRDRCEIVRVTSVDLRERVLVVEYELVSAWVHDYQVPRLVRDAILVELLGDVYRDRADNIRWINAVSGKSDLTSYTPR